MGYTDILSVFLTLVVLGVIVLLVLVPAPIKPLIRRSFYRATYEPTRGETILKENYTLYTNGTNKRIVVVFIGGAFIFSNIKTHYGAANAIYAKLKDTHDVLVLRYPVRFSSTLHDAMLSINTTLSNVLAYETCHAVAFSAGALLAGTFILKELYKSTSDILKIPQIGVNFKSFVGICGLYETDLSSALLTKLFSFYILRSTPNAEKYSCYGINIPRLIISSRKDMLYFQTAKYIQMEPSKYFIYDRLLPHTFVQLINLPESSDAIGRICDFLSNIDRQGDGDINNNNSSSNNNDAIGGISKNTIDATASSPNGALS